MDILKDWRIVSRPIAGRSGSWGKDTCHFEVCVMSGGPDDPFWQGEYSAGIGIALSCARRALLARDPSFLRMVRGRFGVGSIDQLERGAGMTIHLAGVRDCIREWYRPELVDVVSALFCDASGIGDGFESLREWIDNSGMEFDHPADAVEAFEGCREAARFLRAALGSSYDSVYSEVAEL